MPAERRAAVLGHPVAHSLSPRLHGYWLKAYAIDGVYDALDTSPGRLEATLRQLMARGYVGVNLTLPLKEAAMPLMDALDESARAVGAVNTVVMRDGRLRGSNTDAFGFAASLKSAGIAGDKTRALVLGSGGAARAVVQALIEAGARITLAARNSVQAKKIAGKIDIIEWSDAERVLSATDLLVNATPLGMAGQESLALDLASLPPGAAVADLVYRPLRTPLLARAAARGLKTVDGLGMLLYQAQPAFEAWFGVRPEVTAALREHVLGEEP